MLAARSLVGTRAALAVVLVVAATFRVWDINHVGVNSDEAVYLGQAAAIADEPGLRDLFPVFRAHPMLVQSTLALVFYLDLPEVTGRLFVAVLGTITVLLVFLLGRRLYNPRTGIVAALLFAVMPYHVVVSRQVLLDAPMTLFTTGALLLLVRYVQEQDVRWLRASAAVLGLAFLTKETSILFFGSAYVFFALSPDVRLRLRDAIVALLIFAGIAAVYPITTLLAGKTETGGNYFVWQLFRRANHEWDFYLTVVPPAVGWGVVALALGGALLFARRHSWRETLLLAWIAVPFMYFQLWPVKGFQYLLPLSPCLALLAARSLAVIAGPAATSARRRFAATRGVVLRPAAAALILVVTVASMGFTSSQRISPDPSGSLLAGAGGVPGGRELGQWITGNVPRGAVFMTIGPSMANIVQFYGHHRAYGLAVSPNPLHRNPSYDPIPNPDFFLRNSGVQYAVWDAFSAGRSEHFSNRLRTLANRYNGRVVFEYRPPSAGPDAAPLIVVYEVRPSAQRTTGSPGS